MRITIVSPPGEGQLGVSLAHAFEAEDHEVTLVAGRALTAGNRLLRLARMASAEAPISAALSARVSRVASASGAEAVIVIKGRFLREGDVRRLRRRLAVPVVNYYPDNPFHPEFREEPVVRALPAYDLVCAWSEALAEQMRLHGVERAAVVPFAFDPDLFRPRPPGEEYRYDVAFVGQWYPVRQRFLQELAGLRLAISGAGWRDALGGTPLEAAVLEGSHFGREAARLYWASRVGLNILHSANSDCGGQNMRTWELPATATATVATRTADHERLYGEDGAVLIDRPDELRPAVDALLADEERREAIALGGRRAVEAGTYRARARQIAQLIEEL